MTPSIKTVLAVSLKSLTVFYLGCIFASMVWSTLFWDKIKLSCRHNDAEGTTRISTSKAGGISKWKLEKYLCLLTWNEHGKLLSFQTMCLRIVFVSGILHSSERDWRVHFDLNHTLLCWSVPTLFVDFVVLFLFHYETTKNAKFIFYVKENGTEIELKSQNIMGWIKMVKLVVYCGNSLDDSYSEWRV